MTVVDDAAGFGEGYPGCIGGAMVGFIIVKGSLVRVVFPLVLVVLFLWGDSETEDTLETEETSDFGPNMASIN